MMHAMQDALLHLQCTVPHKLVDTFMVNGILTTAAWFVKAKSLIVQLCLDVTLTEL